MKRVCFLYILLYLPVGCSKEMTHIEALPPIFPDYTEVTIPTTIAPLNFIIQEANVSKSIVEFQGESSSFIVKGDETITIPSKKWKALIKDNSTIQVTISTKANHNWSSYSPFNIFVSKDEMDDVICYRRIDPGYATYNKMGIYQRDLTTYNENPIIETTLLNNSCVNCHSFNRCSPTKMQFHIRGKNGGTVLMNDGIIKKISGKAPWAISACVYPYWHPTGNYIVYSVNKTMQNFHNTPKHILDVYDNASDIVLYDVVRDSIIYCPILSDTTKFETFPAFSPDGKNLYFCSAEAKDPTKQLEEIKYGLYSISFDPENGTLGTEIKELYAPKESSILFPRPSYNGKYIVITKSAYGTFPIWHKDADLYLYNINSQEVLQIENINSEDTESYHSWSSNSKWMVFSSRRIDGLHTRPFITHIDENGLFSKPFLVPQKSPRYYERMLQSYNIPEFVSSEVDFDTEKLKKTL